MLINGRSGSSRGSGKARALCYALSGAAITVLLVGFVLPTVTHFWLGHHVRTIYEIRFYPDQICAAHPRRKLKKHHARAKPKS